VVTGTGELVNAVILALAAVGVVARDVRLDSSNLEDAFVRLTGRQAGHGFAEASPVKEGALT
jgi:ABC-2 type transport system ATP-binding protein